MNINQERKYDAVDGKIVNRATGKPIPDHEPIMIFRAKDRNAVKAILAYRDSCKDPLHRAVIEGRVNDFIEFQKSNRNITREPDSDSSCLPGSQPVQ